MNHLIFQKKERVGILTISRPEVLNALNRSVLEELDSFLVAVVPREGIRALVVTGAGEKAFVAGADIKEMRMFDLPGILAFCELGQRVALRLEAMDAITIAAVNGYAFGGGLEIALACDFIYASRTAKLGLPEVTLGLIPGFGGTQRLARAVGTRRAKEIILTGQPITADEAHAIGLVNRVVDGNGLLDSCLEVASQICRNAFGAVARAKQSINDGIDLSLTEGLELEKQAFVRTFDTEDRREGMAAFVEKRRPKFK
jgi:enoyl-CoA hydratase